MLTVNLNVTPPWGEGDAKRIMDALGGPDNVLAVGGCVRDWITGFPVKDIDFATNHPPIKCSELLEKKEQLRIVRVEDFRNKKLVMNRLG